MEDEIEGELTPEFSIDDIVTNMQEPQKNAVLTREQKKSFKYLNKFQNIERSNQNLSHKESTPSSQKKRRSKHRTKSPRLPLELRAVDILKQLSKGRIALESKAKLSGTFMNK